MSASSSNDIIWPAGKRAAAIISVIFDDGMDAVARAPDLATRNKSHSVWLYGANRGVERLCRTFQETNIRTTWFLPGLVAEKHRASVREVAAAGHDVESHGWGFERYDEMPRGSSLELLKRSRQVLEDVTGKPVTGFRLPIGNWPDQFDGLLKESGYLWSASLNGDDVPYLHASSLLEIPVHLELEDRPYFQFNFTPAFPRGQSRIASYEFRALELDRRVRCLPEIRRLFCPATAPRNDGDPWTDILGRSAHQAHPILRRCLGGDGRRGFRLASGQQCPRHRA